MISQDYYILTKRTSRTNGNIYHIFKPNNFRDVQNLCQEEASIGMTLNDFKNLTNTFWDIINQPFTIDKTEGEFRGTYRLGLHSLFVPDSSPFQTN